MGDFLHRHWLAVVAYLTAFVLAGFVGWGYATGWEADAWGALAALFAGVITFGAVAVALREASQGRRDRLVDYEAARRRECINSLSDLWGAIMQIGLQFQAFTFYVDELPERFRAAVPRLSGPIRFRSEFPTPPPGPSIADEYTTQYQDLTHRWVTAVEPHVFRALAVLEDTPLRDGVRDLIDDFNKIINEGLPHVTSEVLQGRRPETQQLKDMWTNLVKRRQAHLELVREYFGLSLKDVERAASGLDTRLPRALTQPTEPQAPSKTPEIDTESDSQPDQPAS